MPYLQAQKSASPKNDRLTPDAVSHWPIEHLPNGKPSTYALSVICTRPLSTPNSCAIIGMLGRYISIAKGISIDNNPRIKIKPMWDVRFFARFTTPPKLTADYTAVERCGTAGPHGNNNLITNNLITNNLITSVGHPRWRSLLSSAAGTHQGLNHHQA